MTLTLTLLHWWRPQPFFLLFYMSMRVWQLGVARSYYHWMLVCLKWQQEKLYHDQRTNKQKTSLSIFNLIWHRLPKLDQTLAYLTLLSVCSVNWHKQYFALLSTNLSKLHSVTITVKQPSTDLLPVWMQVKCSYAFSEKNKNMSNHINISPRAQQANVFKFSCSLICVAEVQAWLYWWSWQWPQLAARGPSPQTGDTHFL